MLNLNLLKLCTYKKFYESLGQTSQNMLNEKIKGDEYVSLYKREFLGIDKECDEKTDIKKEDYEKLRKAQKMERVCVLVEAVIILCFWVVLFIIYTCIECKSYSGAGDETYVVLFVFLVICFLDVYRRNRVPASATFCRSSIRIIHTQFKWFICLE